MQMSTSPCASLFRKQCLTLLGLTLLSAQALAEPVCEVLAVSGEALLQTGEDGRALVLGERLEAGAELRTGAGGRVRLRFLDGSTLVMADRSRLRIEQFEQSKGRPREASLLLLLGLIGQKVSSSAGGSWRVHTPTAVTAVRGTEFMVEVDDKLATLVHVQSGVVAVEPAAPMDAASTAYSSKSAITGRGRAKGPAVMLKARLNGTHCDGRGPCSPAKAVASETILQLQQRLMGINAASQ